MPLVHHGVSVTEASTGVRDLRGPSSAVIGLVAIAPDADAAVFPLDAPVLLTDVRAAVSKAGEDGTLAGALGAIADQTNPLAVVVRVAEGVDEAATSANVIAGLQLLLSAESVVGVKPRILGAPGLDVQTVTTAMVVVAQKLRAFAYASCDEADTVAEAVTYRDEFSARELMLIYPGFTFGGAEAYAVARAMGLRARIDEEQGWHKSLSNVAVNGVTGLSRPIFFDLQDPDTDAGVLNAADVTALIHRQGYRFWGNRTCSDEPLFAFETTVRTGQMLRDTIADGMLWAIDKPLHPSLARDILETINAEFRQLKAQGRIIDGSAWLEPAENTAETLAAGQLHVSYDYTPVPPLEHLGLTQRITDKYLASFVDQVNGAA